MVIKLTEDTKIGTYLTIYDILKPVKQQILDDQEKARKWDINGKNNDSMY